MPACEACVCVPAEDVPDEGAGEEDDLGAFLAQLPEQVGKTDVVADRAADFDPVRFVGDDLVAGAVAVAFAVARAVGGDDIE